MKIFLTGGSSGIGRATFERLSEQHDVYAPSTSEFDLSDFGKVDSYDLTQYGAVVNCGAKNAGTHLGLHVNSWQNQVEQVNVNFTGALLLAKRYLQCRESGHLIFVTSTSIDIPKSYNIFMASSKSAIRFSMDVFRKEYPSFIFTEICPDKTRTNMLHQNYQDRKTYDEIEAEYSLSPTLSADQVASTIQIALDHKLDKVTIYPHTR